MSDQEMNLLLYGPHGQPSYPDPSHVLDRAKRKGYLLRNRDHDKHQYVHTRWLQHCKRAKIPCLEYDLSYVSIRCWHRHMGVLRQDQFEQIADTLRGIDKGIKVTFKDHLTSVCHHNYGVAIAYDLKRHQAKSQADVVVSKFDDENGLLIIKILNDLILDLALPHVDPGTDESAQRLRDIASKLSTGNP